MVRILFLISKWFPRPNDFTLYWFALFIALFLLSLFFFGSAHAQAECFYDQDGNWICISAVRFGPAAYLPIIFK